MKLLIQHEDTGNTFIITAEELVTRGLPDRCYIACTDQAHIESIELVEKMQSPSVLCPD